MPLPITAQFKVKERHQTETKINIRLVPTGVVTNADQFNLSGRNIDTIELMGVGNDVMTALPPGTLVSVIVQLP